MENGAEMKLDLAQDRLVLALDTSTASLAAAVLRGDRTLGAVQSMAERNHSVQTVPQIKALLAECGVTPEELDALAIGRGPGSYTGMRIAVSVGKTLAWAWNKPLVGVSSLEALAYGAWKACSGASTAASPDAEEEAERSPGPSETDWIVPIMDARRGQVYTALFAVSPGGGWRRLAEDGIRLMRDWVERLDERQRAGAADSASVRSRVRQGESVSDSERSTVAIPADDRQGEGVSESGLSLAARADERQLSGSPDPHSGRPVGTGQDHLPVSEPAPSRIWVVGDLTLHETEAERLRSLCETGSGLAGSTGVRLFPYAMDGRAVAALGAMRLARGERDDVHSFVPNYTQLAEAEVKLLAKQQCGEVSGP